MSNMDETVKTKVINRVKFVESVLAKAKKQEYNEGKLYTINKLAENAKKMRIGDDGKALVLLGSNVYKVTYDVFAEALKESIEQHTELINQSEINSKLHIEELDANDKLIGKL